MAQNEDDLEFSKFSRQAHDALDGFRKSFSAKVADAISSPGLWHPNGFVVWPVTKLSGLGTLRLHIWPDRDRVAKPWGLPIHRHDWHLASTVLVGTYRDTLYADSSIEPASSTWRRMNSHQIEILADNHRRVVAEEEVFFISESEVRVVHAPGFHYVPAGVFHETLIPEGRFVATLIIAGEHRGPKPLALQEFQYPSCRYQWELLHPENVAPMLEDLKNRISLSDGQP
jgi:hypothetical protein